MPALLMGHLPITSGLAGRGVLLGAHLLAPAKPGGCLIVADWEEIPCMPKDGLSYRVDLGHLTCHAERRLRLYSYLLVQKSLSMVRAHDDCSLRITGPLEAAAASCLQQHESCRSQPECPCRHAHLCISASIIVHSLPETSLCPAP